jgi:hypothetical protein
MLNHRCKIRLFVTLLIAGILSGIILLPVIYSLSGRLSKTTRVKAEVLLVEGWLPPYAIRMAYDEFKKNNYEYIVTTGLKSTSDYFNVYSNGFLVFNTQGKSGLDTGITKHSIEIKAFSSLSGKNCARFNVFINNSLVRTFSADKKKRNYLVEWNGPLSEVDSVSVQFVNDTTGDFGDRDLFVKEIILDHKISIPYQLNSVYEVTGTDRTFRIKNNYDSFAKLARNKLIAMGIDSSLIIDIPGNKVVINRTLKSALAFRDWLLTSDKDFKGINIVTLGTHAKRTWMIYNRIINKKYDIGIISLPDYRENHSRKYKVLKTLREAFGIIYYWFILIPY